MSSRGRELSSLKKLVIKGGSYTRAETAAQMLENLGSSQTIDELVFDG